MAFQHNEFGLLVSTDPTKAHGQLTRLLKLRNCKVAVVAKELGVTSITLRRWIAKLIKLGYSDPRGAVRAVRGPGIAKVR